jgi:hypothetical protein
VRYALPALFGFLALFAVIVTSGAAKDEEERSGSAKRDLQKVRLSAWLGRAAGCGLLIVSLWSDAQWYFDRSYRKGDSRAVADWLVTHRNEIKSWTVLPDYLATSVQFYLDAYPEIRSRFLRSKEPQNTSFPPLPDVLILGRRHHLPQAEQIINSYSAMAGNVEEVHSLAGFELFMRRPQ